MNSPTPEDIRSLRAEFKLNAADFAAIVYLGEGAVNAWEQGRRQMPPITWEFYLTYFGRRAPRVHPSVKPGSDVESVLRTLRQVRKLIDKL